VQWLAAERFFGDYRRHLSLGEGIDASAITATYENGVLTVTIPLAEVANPRKIEIAHGAGPKVIEGKRPTPRPGHRDVAGPPTSTAGDARPQNQ